MPVACNLQRCCPIFKVALSDVAIVVADFSTIREEPVKQDPRGAGPTQDVDVACKLRDHSSVQAITKEPKKVYYVCVT